MTSKSARYLKLFACLVLLAIPLLGAGYGTVSCVELKRMIERHETGLVVIDSRSASLYEESHIPGALSIPLADMDHDPALPKVPKESRLVFYCSGST